MAGVVALLLLGATATAVSGAATPMPPPFERVLRTATPAMQGSDVYIASQLLVRFDPTLSACADTDPPGCSFDGAMATAVTAFQHGRPDLSGDSPGTVGPSTATAMLAELQFDR